MGMDPEMDFEYAMRLLFGDTADHIAGQAHMTEYRNKWLRRAIDKMLKLVDKLDTSPRHRERLVGDLNGIRKSFSKAKQPSWSVVFHFFSLCGRLFGFDFSGARTSTPQYVQEPNQHYTEQMKHGGDTMQDYHDCTNFVAARARQIVHDLKQKGFNDFQVAMVLSTTEREVKQLKREAAASNTSKLHSRGQCNQNSPRWKLGVSVGIDQDNGQARNRSRTSKG